MSLTYFEQDYGSVDQSSELVQHAFVFSKMAHRGQFRIDGVRPYIVHPVLVMNILIRHGHTDEVILAAALLHDVMEDCNIPKERLQAAFGAEVANIVASVSDDPAMGRTAAKRKMIQEGHLLPVKSKILKSADRLANLQDLYEHEPKSWHAGAIQGYTRSSIKLMDAIACDENLSIRTEVLAMVDKIFERYGR